MKKLLCFVFVTLMCFSAFAAAPQTGNATYYSKKCRGITSSGERHNPDSMICAHRTHPFGTLLKVTHLGNGKSVIVKVNDRGPFGRGNVVDLSYGAAQKLNMVRQGKAKVKVEVVDPNSINDETIMAEVTE